MAWVATGVTVAANLYTGMQSADAIKAAGEKSAQASRESLEFQKQMYARQTAEQEPFIAAGREGLAGAQRLATDPNAYKESPFAHWSAQKGQQAGIAASQASGGLSGGSLAALSREAQGQAGAGFQDQYNRFAKLAGLGESATSASGAAGSTFAANAGNIRMQDATTQGNTGMALAGNEGTTLNSVINAIGKGAGIYNTQPQNPMSAPAPAYDFSNSGMGTSGDSRSWGSSMPNQMPSANWYS